MRSRSKCGPNISLVESSPPSPASTKLTPLPSEYMALWVFRRWKKLLAILALLAVKSTSFSPVRSNIIRT